MRSETGFSVTFVTKPGVDTWVPRLSTPSPRVFFPQVITTFLRPSFRVSSTPLLTPSASTALFVRGTSTSTPSTTFTSTSFRPTTAPVTVTPPLTTSTATTSTTSGVLFAASGSASFAASSASASTGSGLCGGLRNPCGKAPAFPSRFCKVCTDLYLRAKYNFPSSFGERCWPRLPSDCDQFQLLGDVRLCQDYRMRAKMQSWLLVHFPPAPSAATTVSEPLVATGLPTLPCDQKGGSATVVAPTLCLVDPPTSSPLVSSVLGDRVSASALPPTLPYSPSRCDHDCPLCERKFDGKDSKKVLAKHVNLDHSDPDNPRLKVWLEASHRSWCSDCSFSYSQRQRHFCKEPVLSTLPLASTSSSPVTTVREIELRVSYLIGWRFLPPPSLPSNGSRSNVAW